MEKKKQEQRGFPYNFETLRRNSDFYTFLEFRVHPITRKDHARRTTADKVHGVTERMQMSCSH